MLIKIEWYKRYEKYIDCAELKTLTIEAELAFNLSIKPHTGKQYGFKFIR
jgi:hypothetical protein